MYHYVYDKKFLSKVRSLCGDIMQELCHHLKKEYDISSRFSLVGSGARNLITQNETEPIDLDYNLEILYADDYYSDLASLKESVRKAFNYVLNKHGWEDCQDSTSSLTTKKKSFKKGNKTKFSIDVAIVKSDRKGGYSRLIHGKTGWTIYDRYFWNYVQSSEQLKKKIDYIKDNNKWEDVREEYLRLKNKCLSPWYNQENRPSFICYTEAVNKVYGQMIIAKNFYSIW